MARQLFVLWSDEMRRRAVEAVARAAPESRVTVQGPKRTLKQNAKLHAMLEDIAEQHKHAGKLLTVKQWKWLFLHLLGAEQVEWLPSLAEDGELVPVGTSTSELEIADCADLIELIYAKGAEWGVIWTEPKKGAPAP